MKEMDIEKLVQWAYRDELPKASGSGTLAAVSYGNGWEGISRFGELMTVVDTPDYVNRYGVVPNFHASDDPHPDALKIADAVASLDEVEIRLPESWNCLADFGELNDLERAAIARAVEKMARADAKGQKLFHCRLSVLVTRAAILGHPPAWQGERPKLDYERDASGRPRWFAIEEVLVTTEEGRQYRAPREVDGFNPSSRRPKPGAYQRQVLKPDPLDLILNRAEYELWHASLGFLVEELEGRLEAHQPLACARPAEPWLAEGAVAAE